MNYSMDSEERDPARYSLSRLFMNLPNICRWANELFLFFLDFSKAFDKVAHEKLLLKLHHYGIRGDTLKCIEDILDDRKRTVVINGINSDKISVSCMAQFSVQLILAHINDLPEQVKSRVRLLQTILPCTLQ